MPAKTKPKIKVSSNNMSHRLDFDNYLAVNVVRSHISQKFISSEKWQFLISGTQNLDKYHTKMP